MSVKMISSVLDNDELRGEKRIVMMVLADSSNDEGDSCASTESVAKYAGLSIEETKKTIRELADNGYLVKQDSDFVPVAEDYDQNWKIVVQP